MNTSNRLQKETACFPHEHFCAEVLRTRFASFIELCRISPTDFCLTPLAEPSAYARCFAVFGLHLIGERKPLDDARDQLVWTLRRDIRLARGPVTCAAPRDKNYRQLLCFTLSALSILQGIEEDPLLDLVAEQVPVDVASELMALGSLTGRAQSGNHAMFLAIFLLHLRRYSDAKTRPLEIEWLRLHLEAMNRFGFWGPDAGPTHLHFQNGYHQYEIVEFFGAENPRAAEAVAAVASLGDPQGHFAPYPGGGGCFDYDAVFVLTPDGQAPSQDNIRWRLLREPSRASPPEELAGLCRATSKCTQPRSLERTCPVCSYTSTAQTQPHPNPLERLLAGLG
jgi:hypothetical protein